MKNLFAFLVLGLLLGACEQLPPVKNQKYLKCVDSLGDLQYYLIQDMKFKGVDMYTTGLQRSLGDATFKDVQRISHGLMYSSDKYLVFDANWLFRGGTFALNRITLEAGPLYKFYETPSKMRNDAYINELFPSIFKHRCELTVPLKKQI